MKLQVQILVAVLAALVTLIGGLVFLAKAGEPTPPLSGTVMIGKAGCPNKVRPGFTPPATATHCEVFNATGNSMANVEVEGGRFYCSVPNGYVTCTDAQGKRMRPDMTRAMCPFDGPTPTCPELLSNEGGPDNPTQ